MPDGALEPLLAAIADDPAVIGAMGKQSAVFAVPDAARAMAIASVVAGSERRPFVVAVPNTAEAERLAADLETYLGPGEVALFPAWETLPFERVSPNIETMGRRLEVLWELRDPQRAPAVIVSSARALAQRLGPDAGRTDPIIVGVGDRIDLEDLTRELVAGGYRREPQVEHRGNFAVRGSIVDVFPSTGDAPVRIDLWGD